MYLLTGVLLAVSVAIALLGLRGMEQVVARLDSVYKDRWCPARHQTGFDALSGAARPPWSARWKAVNNPAPQAAQALTQQLKLARQHWHDYLATYLVETSSAKSPSSNRCWPKLTVSWMA